MKHELATPAGSNGRVYLGGARPRDPALLTLRGPGQIPEEVSALLDALLSEEAEARGSIAAEELPTLAAQGAAFGAVAERMRLWRGDLTVLRADAIVNAANSQMLGCFIPGHLCIDNVIHASAGPGLRAECAEHMRRQGTPSQPAPPP